MYTRVILLIVGWAIGVNGASLIHRIVGGQNADAGMHPYQAMIKMNGFFMCGGSIISEHLILTAAHCVYQQSASQYTVTVGTYYSDSLTNSGVKYFAKELIWHSEFDDKRLINDVGLIRLKERILFTSQLVQPIPLPSVDYVAPGENAVVTGWGQLSAIGTVSSSLQAITLKIISQEECKKKILGIIDTQICTFTKLNEGVCFGDSGGPLVVNGKQIGIVSFGVPCARGIPDVYTRVYSYKSWISHHAALIGDHINTANTFSKTWIPILIATLTYLHFLA